MLKLDRLHYCKTNNYNRKNCEALDHCHQQSPDVKEYIRVFLKILLQCEIHMSCEGVLCSFQGGLWDKLRFKFWFSIPQT